MRQSHNASSTKELLQEIAVLKEERHAVIIAHNYQPPEIQDLADHTGDSLELSRLAAKTDARVIVFCGVKFMAETAAILSPDKTVLLPVLEAGCTLADYATAGQIREMKQKYPGALVVTYVNSSAEVKAESDICCTSANAVDIVKAMDPSKQIIFAPDYNLGHYVQRDESANDPLGGVLPDACASFDIGCREGPKEVAEGDFYDASRM